MKTQKTTNRTLPSPARFSLYIVAVAVVCFLNWNALKAADYNNSTLEERLAEALVPVADPEPQVEDWMLTFADESLAETEIALEDWMLSFQSNPAIEDWMVSTETWITPLFLVKR